MANLAKQVTEEQTTAALEYIIANDISLIGSTKYDLEYKGKAYPPKEVVRKAAELANIPNWQQMSLYGGDSTNEPLRKMGFTIKNKRTEDINLTIIAKYKNLVSEDNNKEIYKWRLLQTFNGRPDTSAQDFASEITSINFGNFIYHNGIAVRNDIAKEFPEDYRKAFQNLFDEDLSLEQRVTDFQDRVSAIYKKMGKKLNHHHDERTISTFLTFKYPEKYTLYKNSFYKSYCDLLGIKPESKNKKYVHYLTLIQNLIANYIANDQELLDIKNKFITEDCYTDTYNLIFAQDILYQVLNSAEEIDGPSSSSIIMKNKKQPLNQILFGPPGTGKTYNTIDKAISIINPEFNLNQNRAVVKAEYDKLVKVGQIVFTTFHQSMGYEDFVEGIKPEIEEDSDGGKTVIYEIKKGIFRVIAEKAQEIRYQSEEVSSQYTFEDAWNKIVTDANQHLETNNPLKLSIQTPNLGLKIVEVTEKGNLKLKPIYSEDAKEYIVSFSRAKKLQAAFPDLSVIKNIDKEFRAVMGGSNSTAYWAVLNYVNSKIKSTENRSTKQEIQLPPSPYVLIIDEINRGNVSQIFGELITLIEEDKRLGNPEELKLTLPYSKEEFGVPPNLHIIGTMNTADRSVEALDTALRRRFSFEEILPNLEVLNDKVCAGISLKDLLSKLNERVEILLDRDHAIGHSYFININSEEDLKYTFKNNIVPLLQEYFYGDYEKIGMIIGKGFFEDAEPYTKDTFASFATQNYPDSGSVLRLKKIDDAFDITQALSLI